MYTNSLYTTLSNLTKPLWGQQGSSDEMAQVLDRPLGRALVGFPLNGWALKRETPAQVIEKIIDIYDLGQIVELDWHIWHPDADGYFSRIIPLEERSVTKHSNYLEDEIERLISEILLPLKAEGINLLFRPFHECSGAWFWWGYKGNNNGTMNSGEDVKNLHKMVFNKLEFMEATNALYVWNVNSHGSNSEAFGTAVYPGADYCHVVSFDHYTSTPTSIGDNMDWIADLATQDDKLLAIAEFGLNTKTQQVWSYGEYHYSEDLPLYWSKWVEFTSRFPNRIYERTWWAYNKKYLPDPSASKLQALAYEDMVKNYLPTMMFAGEYAVSIPETPDITPGKIAFSKWQSSVNETGVVSDDPPTLIRTEGYGTCSVTIEIAGRGSEPNVDFKAQSLNVTFEADEMSKIVDLSSVIIDNDISNKTPREIQLRLKNPTDSWTVDKVHSTFVSIIDNEPPNPEGFTIKKPSMGRVRTLGPDGQYMWASISR